MSATDMSPPPLPQPALALPDLAPGTCTGGSLSEVELDEGDGGSQQTAALPVQGTIKEEDTTVSLPQHAEDVLEKSIKICDHTVRDSELHMVDGGSMSQPDMQIMRYAFGEGGEDKGNEKVKEKGSDAWVAQTIGEGVIIDIDKVPTADDANDAPIEDNATPSLVEALGTDIASVVPVVHQPFRQPTLFVPSSLALPVDQGTVDEASKPAYLFAAPPPPGSFIFGKPPSQLSPSGASNASPAPGLVHPPQSAMSPFFTPQPAGGSAQLGVKFTPHTPIFTSTGTSTMTTSDCTTEPIIKAEEMEQFPMVANCRSSLMDAIPSTVKKRLLPQEVLQLSRVQERIDAAQDANSLKDIRNVQSRIYDEQHGLTPAKRQKLNDEGKGKEPVRQFHRANAPTTELLVYEATGGIGGSVKVSGKTREPPIGPRAVSSSSMPQRSPHTVTAGSFSAMNREQAPAQFAPTPSQLRFPPQINQLYQRPPAAAIPELFSATSRQPTLSQFVLGLPQQQPPPVNGLQAATIPRKLTVLTLPRLDFRANRGTAQVALDIINEANSLLSQYTDVQLAFSARDMGFTPTRLN